MAKRLRLAVAALTDVGRKRERNQDNVAHHVPQDEDTLRRRGAIFVVADGMGGHAAGEVASQLAIKTITDAYYSAPDTNIVASLAYAVEQANSAIYGHAREHPELAGMGTTCVSVVLADGRGYIVNVGDSRAYIVRQGKMTQLTQDHSWVAEQVRNGILSEEQARHHTHRNVITRSLGTQPSVTADLFIENMHDGDRLLLCSDGLHGYVDEAEIAREMINEAAPEDTAHTLIAMANANGGPDNISAVVIHLLEVPAPAEALVLPPSVAAAAHAVATTTANTSGATSPLPIVTAPVPAVGVPAGKGGAIPGQALPRKPTRRSRRIIYLLEIVALLALAAGTFYYFFGQHTTQQLAAQHVQADLTHAQHTVTQAPTLDPVAALAALGGDRKQLLTDLGASDLTATQRESVQNELATQIQPAIQAAMQRYNDAALFRTVPSNSVVSYSDSASACTAPGATSAAPLKSVTSLQQVSSPPPKNGPAPPLRYVYALSGGVVYELIAPIDATSQAPAAGAVRCVALPLVPQVFSSVASIATDGSTLFALGQHSDGTTVVDALPAQGYANDGSLDFGGQSSFNVPTPGGEKVTHVVEQGGTYYVSFEANGGADFGVWVFAGDPTKGPSKTVKLPTAVSSMVISNGTLYLLLNDGSIGQLDSTPQYKSSVVSAPAPLPADPSTYSYATPVPVLTPQDTAAGSRFSSSASLGLDPYNQNRLVVSAFPTNRVVQFTAGGPGTNPVLAVQYLYTPAISSASASTVTSVNGQLFLYLWSQNYLVAFPAPNQ
ncbi:MAG TPA: Stp1/IreP family PP2C-type Ser/Thr phosphatase [Ktedonobacterales bacterium]